MIGRRTQANKQRRRDLEARPILQAGKSTVVWEASLVDTDTRPSLQYSRLPRHQVTPYRLHNLTRLQLAVLMLEGLNLLR